MSFLFRAFVLRHTDSFSFFFPLPSQARSYVTFKRRRFVAWVKSSIRCVSIDDVLGSSSLDDGKKQIGSLRRSWSETRLRESNETIDPIDFAEKFIQMWKRHDRGWTNKTDDERRECPQVWVRFAPRVKRSRFAKIAPSCIA